MVSDPGLEWKAAVLRNHASGVSEHFVSAMEGSIGLGIVARQS